MRASLPLIAAMQVEEYTREQNLIPFDRHDFLDLIDKKPVDLLQKIHMAHSANSMYSVCGLGSGLRHQDSEFIRHYAG